MITLRTKCLKDNKTYTVVEMGPWGFKLRSAEDELILSINEMSIDIMEGKLTPITTQLKYDIDDLKAMAQNPSQKLGLYASVNEQNEDIIVKIDKDYLELQTLQDNGWVRVNYYEYIDENWVQSETYEGRWR